MKIQNIEHFRVLGPTHTHTLTHICVSISEYQIKKSDDNRLGDCDLMQNDAITLNIILSIFFSDFFSLSLSFASYGTPFNIYASISNQFLRVRKKEKNEINGHIAKILWMLVNPLMCKDQEKK